MPLFKVFIVLSSNVTLNILIQPPGEITSFFHSKLAKVTPSLGRDPRMPLPGCQRPLLGSAALCVSLPEGLSSAMSGFLRTFKKPVKFAQMQSKVVNVNRFLRQVQLHLKNPGFWQERCTDVTRYSPEHTSSPSHLQQKKKKKAFFFFFSFCLLPTSLCTDV